MISGANASNSPFWADTPKSGFLVHKFALGLHVPSIFFSSLCYATNRTLPPPIIATFWRGGDVASGAKLNSPCVHQTKHSSFGLLRIARYCVLCYTIRPPPPLDRVHLFVSDARLAPNLFFLRRPFVQNIYCAGYACKHSRGEVHFECATLSLKEDINARSPTLPSSNDSHAGVFVDPLAMHSIPLGEIDIR